MGIYKLTHSEIIRFPQGSDSHYGSNTNLYTIKNPETGSLCVDSCVYTQKQMMNIIYDLSTYNGVCPRPDRTTVLNGEEIPLWSGRRLLSYILPEIVDLDMPNNSYDNNKSLPPGDVVNHASN